MARRQETLAQKMATTAQFRYVNENGTAWFNSSALFMVFYFGHIHLL